MIPICDRSHLGPYTPAAGLLGIESPCHDEFRSCFRAFAEYLRPDGSRGTTAGRGRSHRHHPRCGCRFANGRLRRPDTGFPGHSRQHSCTGNCPGRWNDSGCAQAAVATTKNTNQAKAVRVIFMATSFAFNAASRLMAASGFSLLSPGKDFDRQLVVAVIQKTQANAPFIIS